MPKSKTSSPRKRAKISRQRMALIILSQLRNLARVHRARGEILDRAAWLRVIANVLSSAPSGYMGSRRGRTAPPFFFGLTVENLAAQADACGLQATDDEIKAQVFETNAWRQEMTLQTGEPFLRRMSADKMGELLGVTLSTMEEAKAWNIGFYGGDAAQREKARLERDRLRKIKERREAGVKSWSQRYEQNLSKLQPWKAENISRRTWERRRARETAAAASESSSGDGHLTQPRPPHPRPRPLVEIDAAASAPSCPNRDSFESQRIRDVIHVATPGFDPDPLPPCVDLPAVSTSSNDSEPTKRAARRGRDILWVASPPAQILPEAVIHNPEPARLARRPVSEVPILGVANG